MNCHRKETLCNLAAFQDRRLDANGKKTCRFDKQNSLRGENFQTDGVSSLNQMDFFKIFSLKSVV